MKNCGTCAVWKRTSGKGGECHFAPPQVIFMGFAQAKLAGQPPMPIINAAFPGIDEDNGCAQHVALPPASPTIDTIAPKLPERSAYVDHTASHDKQKSAGGVWYCQKCHVIEAEMARTPCVDPMGANDA